MSRALAVAVPRRRVTLCRAKRARHGEPPSGGKHGERLMQLQRLLGERARNERHDKEGRALARAVRDGLNEGFAVEALIEAQSRIHHLECRGRYGVARALEERVCRRSARDRRREERNHAHREVHSSKTYVNSPWRVPLQQNRCGGKLCERCTKIIRRRAAEKLKK